MTQISSSNNRIAQNTIMLYFRMLLMIVINLYTSRVVLQVLGVSDFGIYNVIGSVVLMFVFLKSSMAISTQRYLNIAIGEKNDLEVRNIFLTSVNIHIILAFIVFVLSELVGLWFLDNYMNIPSERFEAAIFIFHFSVLSTVVIILSVPFDAIIIANEKMKAFAFISILDACLKLGIVFLLLEFEYDKLKFYAVLMFIVQLINRSVYGIYCKRNFKETKFAFYWNKSLFLEMLNFAGWNVFGNFSSVLFNQGLNLLLNVFFGSTVNAARGIALQVQNVVRGFCQNFQMALNPQIIKSYANSEIQRMHSLIYLSSKFSFFLLFIISIPIVLEAKSVLEFWLTEVPDHTVNFIRLILLISLIEVLANPLIQGALASGKIKRYQIYVSVLLLCILPISYILLKLGLFPEIVFIVHLFIVVVSHYVRIHITCKLINMSKYEYFKKVILPIIRVVLCSFLLLSITYYILNNYIVFWVLKLLITVLICILSVFIVGLSSNEKVIIINRLQKVINR